MHTTEPLNTTEYAFEHNQIKLFNDLKKDTLKVPSLENRNKT
jgi:hypothetical protein